MHCIREWLWVSGFSLASNRAVIANHEIDAILQLHKPFAIPGVTTLYLPMIDGQSLSERTLNQAIAFIVAHYHADNTLLMTCGAGISRSVTMATVALREIEGLSLREAYHAIRRNHPDALPDHIHWEMLRAHYDDGPPLWEIWQELIAGDLDDFES